jgi:hypothetical protein
MPTCTVDAGALSQSESCRNYLACEAKLGGAAGGTAATYGPAGACWTTVSTAETCDRACQTANETLFGSAPATDAGCVFPTAGQTVTCAEYVACYHKTGADPAVVDFGYGPTGTCWTNSVTAAACDRACTAANDDLRESGVAADAGCAFTYRGGQSRICARYLACEAKRGTAGTSLDCRYGRGGSCWVSASEGTGCDEVCRSSLYAAIRSGAAHDAGCENSIPQTVACADYVTCSIRAFGGSTGVEASYGPLGSCWADDATAMACDQACGQGNASLQMSGVAADAGCTFH